MSKRDSVPSVNRTANAACVLRDRFRGDAEPDRQTKRLDPIGKDSVQYRPENAAGAREVVAERRATDLLDGRAIDSADPNPCVRVTFLHHAF